ncbi:TlpA disulfide reductase family protein [Thalassospira lucentensis]|uniref:TlpA disulfide reductase family protein n=1 Tax=Thalassospira lucentensis TaxID=168935 RepID=UPI00142E72FA|nr:TlpA family protein disulfide reductase [Thalassospira lucentensis]
MKSLLRFVKLGVIVAISGIYATPAFAEPQFPSELSKMIELRNAESLLENATFVDAAGTETSLNSLKGQVVLVNLWATWCVPCVKEMPELDQLAAEMADKPMRVLALSQDRGGAEDVSKFFENNRIEHLDVLLDPKGATARAMGARGLPTSFIIDANGELIGKLEGIAKWDAPEVIAYFNRLIDQAS